MDPYIRDPHIRPYHHNRDTAALGMQALFPLNGIEWALEPWPMTIWERQEYESEFRLLDEFHDGYITKALFLEAFTKHPDTEYRLGVEDLQRVWRLADREGTGRLDREWFVALVYVVRKVKLGRPMPEVFPLKLVHATPSLDGPKKTGSWFPVVMNRKKSIAPTRLSYFPDELWSLILERLPLPSLLKVSRTSKKFHRLGVPLLYRDVNLSLYDHEFASSIYDMGDFGIRDGISTREGVAVLSKQCRFALQLLRTPAYGTYIRSLKWTLGLDICNIDVDRDISFVPDWIEGQRFHWDPSIIYEIFSMLGNVVSVDFGGVAACRAQDLGAPCSLFPRAHRIRLKGNLSFKFAWSVLCGAEKRAINFLALHELYLNGDFQPAEYVTVHSSRVVDASLQHEDLAMPKPEVPVGLRNMRRLLELPSLLLRSASIRCLSLSKMGPQDSLQQVNARFYDLTYEPQLYHELARFISRVQPPRLLLAHLGFTVAEWNDRPTVSMMASIWWQVRHAAVAPMDELFRDNLLPVLLRPWKGLEILEIRGVKGDLLRDLVRRCDGDGIELRFKERLQICWHGPRT